MVVMGILMACGRLPKGNGTGGGDFFTYLSSLSCRQYAVQILEKVGRLRLWYDMI